MKGQRMSRIGGLLLLTVWLGLTAFAWLQPAKAFSQTERRPLTQLPELSGEGVLSGKFTENFEKYTLDQFPFRESFRQTKALFHRYVLGQRDNNGIYIAVFKARSVVLGEGIGHKYIGTDLAAPTDFLLLALDIFNVVKVFSFLDFDKL